MANEQNLIPNSERSPSEVRENGRKGGIISGEIRRERKRIADIIQGVRSETELDPIQEGVVNLLEKMKDPKTETKDLVKALEFARDTIGEKPKEQVSAEITGASLPMVSFIEDHVESNDG